MLGQVLFASGMYSVQYLICNWRFGAIQCAFCTKQGQCSVQCAVWSVQHAVNTCSVSLHLLGSVKCVACSFALWGQCALTEPGWVRRSNIVCSAVHTVHTVQCAYCILYRYSIKCAAFSLTAHWPQFVTGGVSAAKQHRVQWSVVQYDVQYKVFFINWGQCAVT